MKTFPWRAGGFPVVLLFLVLPVLVAHAQTYHLLKEISIGGDGHWDYLVSDDDAHRLYVSHGQSLVVIDTQTDAKVGEITDTPGVHGLALAPDLKRGFSSNGGEAKASIVDLTTLKTVAKVDTGKDPDCIVYASGPHEVYTFNGKDNSATVFDANTGKVVATIALPGQPEFAVYDPASNLIYNNIEDKSELVVIDTRTHQIVNTWPLAPGTNPSGIAMDHENQRLIIGCRNQLMLMMDATNGHILSSVPIGEHVDANAFDPHGQLAFSSNGDGTLTIAYADGPSKLVVVQEVLTQKGARTMALDHLTQKLYLPVTDLQPLAPGDPPTTRPPPVPGSFKILVFGK